jgi:hypothetical protein
MKPNSFLDTSFKSSSTAVSRDSLRCISASDLTQQKTQFHNNLSIVIELCLPRRYIETVVLPLLRACSLPQELVYLVVA